MENENLFGFSPKPIETISTKDIDKVNVNEAHIRSVSQYQEKYPTDIPYSELFGRKIDQDDLIDTENSPFDFFEPSANELDSFEDADSSLPLLKLPKIRDEKERLRKKRADSDKYDEVSEQDQTAEAIKSLNLDDDFLERLSNLKDGVLNQNRNSVGIGMFYQSRIGTDGLDALDTFILPALDINYYLGLSHHLYGHLNFINLLNGTVSGYGMSLYGRGAGGNIESVSALGEAMIGYKYKTEKSYFVGEIGTVPQPSVVPEIPYTWRLEYGTKFENASFNIAYVNKSVKDSMLSRIGDEYNYVEKGVDENGTETLTSKTGIRGGITKAGFEIGLKYGLNGEIFAGNVNYYDVSGWNTLPNKEIALTLLYLRVLDLPAFKSFMIGPIFLYDNYTFSSGYFTVGDDLIGNGGYFSPKNFLLIGLYYDMAQIFNSKVFWKLKGNFGYMRFTSGKDIFDKTATDEVISGYGYDIKAFIGYKIDASVQLLGGIGYQSSGPFQSLFLGLTAIYYFGENKSNEIGDLFYSNTLGDMAK